MSRRTLVRWSGLLALAAFLLIFLLGAWLGTGNSLRALRWGCGDKETIDRPKLAPPGHAHAGPPAPC